MLRLAAQSWVDGFPNSRFFRYAIVPLVVSLRGKSDDAKTERQLYVTGFGCDPENACTIMEQTKRTWGKPVDKGILAYHIIQSFSPGEASPDKV